MNRFENNDKITSFLNNTKLLYEAFGIISLLYGSLGLEYLTSENLNSDDIDILIPELYLNKRWNKFCSVLYEDGYVLVDEKEHTFKKEGICYSYARIEELKTFCDIPESEIQTKEENSVKFKILSLEQYLRVYTTSIKDGYRINVRKKKDNEKILFINARLSSKKGCNYETDKNKTRY